jgi:hypothetical protein
MMVIVQQVERYYMEIVTWFDSTSHPKYDDDSLTGRTPHNKKFILMPRGDMVRFHKSSQK